MSGERADSRRSPWWSQAATLLGVIGLLVTLVFNTLAVRQSAKQDREGRETAQISLLTQLNSNASDSESAINETSVPDQLCQRDAAPSKLGGVALRSALDYYEYLSWLFNHDRLTVGDSRAFFAERMVDGWRLGRHLLGHDVMRIKYPQLERFVRDTPLHQRGSSPC
ncbi:MAG: hypothetical protein QOG94_3407 [Solirubrobacteraceae bacterium]|jgi:hypothetical protein|nr:hypothetical protein [Solirubrobacteraceae bacterium]MEA2136908.1 hypothetical protein [Solirubrobacteraceae bacterium]